MNDKELIQELHDKAEVEGAGSTRRLLELAARALERERLQWVSIKDMYPRKGQTVITLLYYTSTHIEYEVAEFNGKYFETDDAYLPIQLVTHWMPLPEPPEEVNK